MPPKNAQAKDINTLDDEVDVQNDESGGPPHLDNQEDDDISLGFDGTFIEDVRDDAPAPVVEVPAKVDTPAPAPVDPVAVRLRAIEGQYGALNDQIAKLTKALNDKGSAPAAAVTGDAPTKQQITAASVNSDKMKKLLVEFPEWAEATIEFTNEVLANRGNGMDEAQAIQTALAASEERRIDDTVSAMLEDWEWKESISRPEFAVWLKTADQKYQDAARRSDATSTLKVMRAYQKSTASKDDPFLHSELATADPADDNEDRSALEAAAVVNSTSRPRRTPSRTEADDLEEGFKQW